MKKNISIGVDIGGSHISCAAVDLNTQKIIPGSFFQKNVDNHASSNVIIRTWSEAILKTIEAVGWNNLKGVGFAMPGPFDYVNGISLFNGETHKYENTYGLNIGGAIKEFLGIPENINVRFINDAVAFAIGEARIGKAINKKRSVSLTIGTGLGSGFIEDGIPIFKGANVPKDGFVWNLPYKESVADDYFSTRGIVNAFHALAGVKVKGAKEVALEAKNNNTNAKKVFLEFGEGLASLLAPWLKKFEAEVLVIGGNISKAFHLFEPSMKSVFRSMNFKIVIEKSDLNDKAQIIGSSQLMDDRIWVKLGK
ncbi:ROK family protein [Thermophagus sp. OGC60D27]|uniref:ROK family protein n=1 Tax=Thermophagus sp. OGC60D27 TaxID=3458415 RepID=UPI00403767DE